MRITKKTLFIASILVIVFVQAPHLMWEFRNMSELPDGWSTAHGALFAIAVDLCVFIFAMLGRTRVTLIFMFISYVVTIQYYRAFINFSENWLGSTSTLLIAAAGVLSIYYLSEEVKKFNDKEDENKEDSLESDLRESIKKEFEQKYNSEGNVVFSPEEKEIITRRTNRETYDDIISDFKKRGIPISRNKINDVAKKFKDLYV